MHIELADFYVIKPLSSLGFTHSFFDLHVDTIAFTWLSMVLVFLGIAALRRWYFSQESLAYVAVEYIVSAFASLCNQTIGYLRLDYLYFITTLFVFTAASCLVSLLPYVEEAARDANTTFALSLTSFFYIVYQAVNQEGLLSYLKHYLGPEEMPMFVRICISPLETMGQLSRIISMSFRLFGNVLGGGIVFQVLVSVILLGKEYFLWAVGLGAVAWIVVFGLLGSAKDEGAGRHINTMIKLLFVVTWAQIFFGIFEAVVQSFVISMLSITYLSLTVHHDVKTDEKGIPWS